MKILVTGGAGFIGSNLVKELVKQGHEVTVLDNYFLGCEENLKDVKDKINLVVGDIKDFELVNKLMKGVDFVFHEAAASSAPMYDKNLQEVVSFNIKGFLNILISAEQNNVKRVIYASTSSIYGDLDIPHKEEMLVTPPNFYSATKYSMEHLAKIFTEKYALETVGFRYFSVYGPNEKAKGRYANIISQFLWDMKDGKRPVIYGDGEQTRDFTYVKDIVKANILAMDMEKKIGGEVFNIGTGKRNSFNEIIEILNKVLGKSIKPVYIENPIKNYVSHTLAGIKKAEKLLGFTAKYSLVEGIKLIKDL